MPAPRTLHRNWLIYGLGALEGLVFGYDSGVVAGALLFIKKDMHVTPGVQRLIVSGLLFGGLIGSTFSGRLAEKIGNRRLLTLVGVIFVIGSLGCARAITPEMLVAFRILLGLGIGIGAVQVPVYLAEIAPAALRGRITSLYQLLIAIGILLAYVIGYGLSGKGDWRDMFAIAAIPGAILCCGSFFIPESPRWLAGHERWGEARQVLLRNRTPEEAESELDGIRALRATVKLSFADIMKEEWLRRMLFLGIALAIFQQMVGINTIVYYTPTILQAAGFKPSQAILTAVGLQSLSVIMTVLLGRIVDHVGRKPLLIGGALVMAASMAALGIIFQLHLLAVGSGATFAVTCLAVFKATFSLTWGPVFWIVLPELLPLKARSRTMSACVFTTYTANFLIASIFPTLLASGTAIAFGTFAVSGIAAAIVVSRFLPETARRTLEQIELAGRKLI